MKACRTCKYWGIDREGQCDYIDLCPDKSATAAWIDVGAADDSGLDARLMTGPNFGCSHHKVSPGKTREVWEKNGVHELLKMRYAAQIPKTLDVAKLDFEPFP